MWSAIPNLEFSESKGAMSNKSSSLQRKIDKELVVMQGPWCRQGGKVKWIKSASQRAICDIKPHYIPIMAHWLIVPLSSQYIQPVHSDFNAHKQTFLCQQLSHSQFAPWQAVSTQVALDSNTWYMGEYTGGLCQHWGAIVGALCDLQHQLWNTLHYLWDTWARKYWDK